METFTHWVTQYGYLGLFGLLMLGIVGLPIPEETLLTFAGVLVYRGHLELAPALLAAASGSACGITVSYGLGRTLGLLITRRFGQLLRLTPERVEQIQAWFARVGHWGLLWGYFLPGIRHLTAVLAGVAKLQYRDFALFAYAGACIWSASFISIGVLIGRQWARVSEQIHHNLAIASAVVVVLLLLTAVARRVMAARSAR